MPDAIQVLKPGWRALDANGNPYPGALLQFFDAGTANAREVFSDYGLSSSLGVDVECDAGGYPTSNGSTKVEVYTGNTRYKLTLKDADGATIWSHDNIIGALDTSGFLTSGDTVPETPITNTSSNQSPVAANKGDYYNINCSGGDVTVTLDNAADVGNGWFIKVRHDGTANQVLLVTSSGELLKIGSHAGVVGLALTRRGQVVTVTSDGVGFKVEESSAALFDTTGIILIADRVASAPGGADAGARYIATATTTWGSLSVTTHDIVEANGQGAWTKYTPPTDCGWIAYVQDEDTYYRFLGSAWVSEEASDTTKGTLERAVQSEMETATALDRSVSPGRQHYHPGHCKAWVNFNGSGTVAIREDYGVSSVTDNNTGDYTPNFDTAFSSTNYGITAWARFTTTGDKNGLCSAASDWSKTTTAMRISSGNSTNTSNIDSTELGLAWFGDQ